MISGLPFLSFFLAVPFLFSTSLSLCWYIVMGIGKGVVVCSSKWQLDEQTATYYCVDKKWQCSIWWFMCRFPRVIILQLINKKNLSNVYNDLWLG